MKKLLYIFALVAFFSYSGFAQVCGGTSTLEFSNVSADVPNGQTGQFNIQATVLSGSPGTKLYYSFSSVSVIGGSHTTGTYPVTGLGTSTLTVNFTVKSPNTTGSETFFITATVNNGSGTCTISGNLTVSTTPIELLAFSGKQNNEGGVHLDWVTASEKNNAMFLVERSNNGTDFTQVGEVKGAGTSSKTINYTFNDGSAVNDAVNYYRLTDVDLNGVKTPSRIISVVVGKNAPLSIYTISAQQGWVSVVSPIAGEAVLNITNAQGQEMSNMKTTLTEGENQVNINTASLNTGIYILNITNNGRVAQTKFFKAN